MSTVPTGATVARARYWLTAAAKCAGILLAVAAGTRAVAALLFLTIALFRGDTFPDAAASAIMQSGADVVTLAAGVSLFLFARRIAAAVFPLATPVCPRCGYPRSGLMTTDPCPECGTPPDTAPSQAQRAPRPRDNP